MHYKKFEKNTNIHRSKKSKNKKSNENNHCNLLN
jgi:hypothetical protein